MPRDLKSATDNKATFMDGVSQTEVSLYYRTPTNAERIAFKAATIGRKNSKVIDQSVEAQLSYGAKILTGIEEGDFLFGGKPISSNEDSGDYNPEWKKLVITTAGDLIQSLALLAFAGVILKYEGAPGGDDDSSIDMSEVPGLDAEVKDAEEDSSQSPLE